MALGLRGGDIFFKKKFALCYKLLLPHDVSRLIFRPSWGVFKYYVA